MRPGLALLLLPGCLLLDQEWKVRGPTAPEDLGDGWEIATPAEVGLDAAELGRIHDELLREDRFFATLGLLVIKDGKLVFETYLRTPADRDRFHHIQSATKSVTSLVFGAARDRGLAQELDATVCSIAGEACRGLEARKKEITLRHLLTMQSGFDFHNEVFSVEMWVDAPSDPLRYILEKPLEYAPGARFGYRDADPQVLALLLEEITGRDEESLAREWLFEPMGFGAYHWDRGPHGTVMGAHGLHLLPRDLARIGQLVLDQGRWKGTQLVSQAWCEQATALQVPAARGDLGYGFYFWIAPGEGAYAAWGHGGQHVLVVPARNLVIVQVALPDGDLHGSDLVDLLELTAALRAP